MKWAAFFIVAVFGVPLMTHLSMTNARVRKCLFGFMFFSTCVKIGVNFMSHEWYRGPDRGFEVTITDLVALALGVALVSRVPTLIKWLPPASIPMFIYFILACISVVGCDIPLFGTFSLFKLTKAYWIYWVTYNTFRIEPPENELWYGLMGIAYYETYICLKQKYMMGMYRVYGTFDHSNSIPIYMIMMLPLVLAWILHGRHLNKLKTIISLVGLAGMCVCILATQSRAGLILMGGALAGVMFRMVPFRMSIRKVGLATCFTILASAGLAKALPTIIKRFNEAPESSEQAREEFNMAAELMAHDFFFGVGYNMFSHVMTEYERYKQFSEVMGNEEHAGVCHHIYFLTAAEMGFIGLGSFLLLMGSIHLRLGLRYWGRTTFERAVVVGIFTGLSVVHVIGLLEWCFRLTPQTNMFSMVAAIGLAYCWHIKQINKANKAERLRQWVLTQNQ
jgi:hypothetical protein